MLSSVSRDILFRFRSQAGAFGGREAPEPEAFLKSPPDIRELVDTVERLTGAGPEPLNEAAPGGEEMGGSSPSDPSGGPSASST